MGLTGLRQYPLKAQFTVRSETHKLQYCDIGLSVNQNQVGLDVTIAVVFPVANQRMVVVLY